MREIPASLFATARRAPRVAIIHYWLVTMRGGERVLERLLGLFPEADVYTHVYVPSAVSDVIRRAKVKTTFIQRLPGAAQRFGAIGPAAVPAQRHGEVDPLRLHRAGGQHMEARIIREGQGHRQGHRASP